MPTSRQKTSDNACQPAFPGDISVASFLQDYWQKKPLLIRNAFPGITSPLSADELAGLACEDDANARIVFEQHQRGHWYVQHGPLHEADFSTLPEKNWSLLVTDVEKHVPAARSLIDRFRFLPDWRIDDLMISYAPQGGSVGPHTDAYDVFLIQTQGQRRWMINQDFDDTCLEDTELRILEHFTAAQEWILDPGDMLYLPPNIAHYGIAMNPCMTCSVGFRAPTLSNMVSEYAEHIALNIDQALRYEDPDVTCQQHPAEISADALARISSMIAQQLSVDDDRLVRWFGEFSSEPRAGIHTQAAHSLMSSYDELAAALKTGSRVVQSPAAKLLFARNGDAALLFVDGASYDTSTAFALAVTDNRSISTQALIESVADATDQQTLLELYNSGCLIIQ